MAVLSKLDLEMEEMKLVVEGEDSGSAAGLLLPVVSVTMGTHTDRAVSLKVQNWSKQVRGGAVMVGGL